MCACVCVRALLLLLLLRCIHKVLHKSVPPSAGDVVLACDMSMYIFAGVLVLSRLVAPAPRRNVDAVSHAALRIHNLQHCMTRPHGLGVHGCRLAGAPPPGGFVANCAANC